MGKGAVARIVDVYEAVGERIFQKPPLEQHQRDGVDGGGPEAEAFNLGRWRGGLAGALPLFYPHGPLVLSRASDPRPAFDQGPAPDVPDGPWSAVSINLRLRQRHLLQRLDAVVGVRVGRKQIVHARA